jgi:hypothetical protein
MTVTNVTISTENSDSSLSSFDQNFSSEDELIHTLQSKSTATNLHLKRKNATPLRRSGRGLSADSSTQSKNYEYDMINSNVNRESETNQIKSKINKTAKKIIEESDVSEFSHNDCEEDDESQYSDISIDKNSTRDDVTIPIRRQYSIAIDNSNQNISIDNSNQNILTINPSDSTRDNVPIPIPRTKVKTPKKVILFNLGI